MAEQGKQNAYICNLSDTASTHWLLAILVGSALGVSGTILQGITKNPLAEPV
ncbi:MAG: iron chelate uptake ABC transporter family permease subunit [[Clostridium] innocuum]